MTNYKYLGVTIDNKLDWHLHTSLLHKKVNKRLFFLRKLKYFKIEKPLMSMFYHSTIESMINFCITAWAGNTRHQDKEKLNRVIRKACKITTSTFPYIDELYIIACTRKISSILLDNQHPLFPQITISTRSNRPRLLICNKERYRRSFLPSSIKLLPSS